MINCSIRKTLNKNPIVFIRLVELHLVDLISELLCTTKMDFKVKYSLFKSHKVKFIGPNFVKP